MNIFKVVNFSLRIVKKIKSIIYPYVYDLNEIKYLMNYIDNDDIKVHKIDKTEKELIFNWIIPDFKNASGGHMTIFRIIKFLELFGHKNYIWIFNPIVNSSGQDAYISICKHFQNINSKVFFINKSTSFSSNDILIATSWQTAYLVNYYKCKNKFYFIQDFEPFFYPKGSNYFLAEETYKMNMYGICAGPWLKEIYEKKYLANADYFMLSYDKNIYYIKKINHIHNKKYQYRIAFYSRLETNRRAVELGLMAFELLSKIRNDFEVLLFGSSYKFKNLNFPHRNLGILNENELADLYSSSDIGICFSATNYSLIPQEMMACKLPVIELELKNNTVVFPKNTISFVKPSPKAIAITIDGLLNNQELRDIQTENAIKWIEQITWEKSAKKVETILLKNLKL